VKVVSVFCPESRKKIASQKIEAIFGCLPEVCSFQNLQNGVSYYRQSTWAMDAHFEVVGESFVFWGI
jgi:hypothetical protein